MDKFSTDKGENEEKLVRKARTARAAAQRGISLITLMSWHFSIMNCNRTAQRGISLKTLMSLHFSIINCKRKYLDFTNQSLVNKWFQKHKPEIVINA